MCTLWCLMPPFSPAFRGLCSDWPKFNLVKDEILMNKNGVYFLSTIE